MSKQSTARRSKKSTTLQVGRVRAYLRGRVWYLRYHEDGRRYQPRVGRLQTRAAKPCPRQLATRFHPV